MFGPHPHVVEGMHIGVHLFDPELYHNPSSTYRFAAIAANLAGRSIFLAWSQPATGVAHDHHPKSNLLPARL